MNSRERTRKGHQHGKKTLLWLYALTDEPHICEHCGYDRRSSNRSHALPAGTVLHGQYLVGKVLGQGGFGITYLGWDKVLDTPVAIKEYYPSGTVFRDCSHTNDISVLDQQLMIQFLENRDRFLREARILGKLENVDEVVKIRNFFVENNTAYIIMGYVHGITLMEHVSRSGGKLTVEETLRLIAPLLKGLDQVHAAGLVHRDLSPDNIMLQSSGKVTIIDFGSAHTAVSGNKSTQAMLKHGFAPPEQYQRRGNLGSWTDVYAICATVYFCLTGTFPPNVTDRMMGGEDFEWDSIPGLTCDQIQALSKGTELSIENRTKTMLELHKGLFQDRTPVKPPAPAAERKAPDNLVPPIPAPPAKAAPAPVKRKKPVGKIAAFIVILLAVLFVLLLRPASNLFLAEHDQSRENGSRVLMEHLPAHMGADNVPVENWYAFRTDVLRDQILSVTVLDTLDNAPENAVDASENLDGSVLAWVEPHGIFYDLYIAAEGGVIAPELCNEMFSGFSNLTQLDLRHLDTSNVISMAFLFNGCVGIETLDLSYLDVSSLESTSYMFAACQGLKELSLFSLNTGRIDSVQGMFCETGSLTDVSVTYDFTKVTSFDEFMDVNDTFNGQPWQDLFHYSASFPPATGTSRILCNIPLEYTDGIPNEYDPEHSYSFDGKVPRNQVRSITFLDSIADAPSHAVDASEMADGFVLAWSRPNGDLYDMYIAAEGGVIAPVYCDHLFSDYTNLTQIDLAALDTSNVTTMYGMFYGCESLTGIDLSGFDTSNVTIMTSMFHCCYSLEALDLSSFDTSQVYSMALMFHLCENLSELDVSGFDTGNLTDAYYFSAGTPNLTSITGDFDFSGVTDYEHFMEHGDLINGRPWEEFFPQQ